LLWRGGRFVSIDKGHWSFLLEPLLGSCLKTFFFATNQPYTSIWVTKFKNTKILTITYYKLT
jgi:hypothetical protein